MQQSFYFHPHPFFKCSKRRRVFNGKLNAIEFVWNVYLRSINGIEFGKKEQNCDW